MSEEKSRRVSKFVAEFEAWRQEMLEEGKRYRASFTGYGYSLERLKRVICRTLGDSYHFESDMRVLSLSEQKELEEYASRLLDQAFDLAKRLEMNCNSSLCLLDERIGMDDIFDAEKETRVKAHALKRILRRRTHWERVYSVREEIQREIEQVANEARC